MMSEVIDLHCHLLPGIDDGPTDMDGTLAMARAYAREGVTHVVATPHVSPDYPNTQAVIAATTAWTQDILACEGVGVVVLAGGELDPPHVADLAPDVLAGLQLGDSGTVLLECPLTQGAPFFEERVARVQRAGLRVLLAHPERSPIFQQDPGLLPRLVAGGALASVTASSFSGRFGRRARAYAEWTVAEQLIHDVASDAHNVDRRPPTLREPLESAGLGWAVDWLTTDAPAAILAGEILPARPVAPRARRFLGLRR